MALPRTPTIAKVTRYHVRTYTDTGQRVAYCEWGDTQGQSGLTGGPPNNPHMGVLALRAIREGLAIGTESW